MTSTPRVGQQEPRIRLEPARVDDFDGQDACFLSGRYGLVADQWQELVITSWLGKRVDGRLASGRCGISVPRQNGKNAILEIVELFKIVVEGRKILHTAHEVKTARKAFMRLASFFQDEEKFPELAALVAPNGIRRTNGQESITLKNGGSIEFRSRSRGGGRGYTVDDLILDEAQELNDEQLEALLPTISAAPSGDPQIIMLGTPVPPGADGAPFRRMRNSGHTGSDERLAWHEWSPAQRPDPTDRTACMAVAAEANPAAGVRLSWDTIGDEFDGMTFDGWMRERCGWWDSEDLADAVIDYPTWLGQAITADEVPEDGDVIYGVKFSADSERVGAAVALLPDDGSPTHVECLGVHKTHEGVPMLAAWLTAPHRARRRIVIDGRSGAEDFARLLINEGVPKRMVSVMDTTSAIAAHAGLLRAINTGAITHTAQPGLDEAVKVAMKRAIGTGGGYGWQANRPGADVTALDAVTVAFGETTNTRRRTRQRSGKAVFA